jgi:hypothetical protein
VCHKSRIAIRIIGEIPGNYPSDLADLTSAPAPRHLGRFGEVELELARAERIKKRK